MNLARRYAYAHIRSLRREDGGLYGVYVGIYSRVYGWQMRRRHRHGKHARLMANGRCTWCGAAP